MTAPTSLPYICVPIMHWGQYDQCRLLSYKDFFACSTQLFVQLCDSDGLLESN